MPIKVLIVDDSSFFRRRVSEIIGQVPELEVAGFAVNGQEAVAQAEKLSPDVITMDIEMPILDGISAVKQIMKSCPTAILMFSSLTQEGAKATLDALDAGAVDFLPKKFEDIAKNRGEAIRLLQQKVLSLGQRTSFSRARRRPAPEPNKSSEPLGNHSNVEPAPAVSRTANKPKLNFIKDNKHYKLLAIGTSTGGPVALQKVLSKLPANFNYPVLLVQHMPAAFTPAFAARLDSFCHISVKEAEDGEVIKPGVAYLAPGGKQMVVEGSATNARLKVFEESSTRVTYKPSVDISFGAAAKVFSGDVLGVILTGMGADGREGCRMLKEQGARIWAQDEQSCVVYGMPQAVTVAGIAEKNIALEQIATEILSEMM